MTTGDADEDSFALQKDNLALILGKIPQGTKVAVVSVVGAFRTGKSFLLNFFLRYLRCDLDTDDLSEDWMTVDGKMRLSLFIELRKGGSHQFSMCISLYCMKARNSLRVTSMTAHLMVERVKT